MARQKRNVVDPPLYNFHGLLTKAPGTVAQSAAQTPWADQGDWLSSCPTWGQRPISKWCRWGYWNETGTHLTVTGIDVKRRAVWLK